jgi:Glycosyltransferase family 87
MSFVTELDRPHPVNSTPVSRLRSIWAKHGTLSLRCAVALMSALALIWLGYQSWRLLFQTTVMGAVDLHLRYDEVHAWFARQPVYTVFNTAVYPPATYALLWPFVGWLDWTPARWFWALMTVGALAWLGAIFVRECEAQSNIHRAFVLLIPLATYPVGATIGNGQLIILQLPLLIAAVLILQRRSGPGADIVAALLLLLALVKPNSTAPFFWVAFFVQMRWRALLLAGLAYVGITVFAATFQGGNALSLVAMSLANGASLATLTDPAFYGNIHVWLNAIGLTAWAEPASVLLFLVLGGCTFLNRRADIWILMGVAGIVARLWTYHGWYDDALILPALVALYRIARTPLTRGEDVAAGLLLGLNVLFMLAPGGVYLLPYPLNIVYTTLQTVLWLAMLVFLMVCARRLPMPAAGVFARGVPAVTPRSGLPRV